MNDDQHVQTGRVMFLIAWIILFLLLFTFFYFHEKRESTVVKISRTELVISADQDGHYRIKGMINHQPVEFLVDTGATVVAIPQELAVRIHLTGRYPITMSTASGEITGYLDRVQELSFGDFTFENVKVVIVPSKTGSEVLLGMNVLSLFNLTQQNKQLILKRL